MNATPPAMPTGFWTPDKLDRMWYYARWFVAENQVFVMIGLGIAIAGTLAILIVNLMHKAKQGDDETDYEYRDI